MVRPSRTDYQQAYQNPQLAFRDPALQHAQTARNRLGLPNLMSGSFAVVCNLYDGDQAWAVRSFLQDVPDLQQRYTMISSYLASKSGLPSPLVGFRYVPEGILVNGAWHPVVVMDWVQGVQLDKAIERRLADGQSLRPLINAWTTLVSDLETLGIAHGDLQHGNILANGDSLCLVDYDGMFVPTMAGMSANEQGLPGYQHPSRSTHRFDATLDRFSALLIFTALCALDEDPGLWRRHRMPDNSLLFRKADLDNPRSSNLFKDLLACEDLFVRYLTQVMMDSIESNTIPASLQSLIRNFNASISASRRDPSGWWKPQDASEHSKAELVTAPDSPLGAGWIGAYLPQLSGSNGSANAASSNLASETPPLGTSWIQAVARQVPDGAPLLIASRTSSTFHVATCDSAKKISAKRVIAFSSVESALRSGFAPCKFCRPDRARQPASQLSMRTEPTDLAPPEPSAGTAVPTAQKWNPAKVSAILRSPAGEPETPLRRPGFPNARVDLGSQVTLAYENGTLDVVRLVRAGGQQKGMNQIAEDTALGQAMHGAYVGDTISYLQLGRLCEATIVDVS